MGVGVRSISKEKRAKKETLQKEEMNSIVLNTIYVLITFLEWA